MDNQTPDYNPRTESVPKVYGSLPPKDETETLDIKKDCGKITFSYGSMPPFGEQETAVDVPEYNPEQVVMYEMYACEAIFDTPDNYNDLGAETDD